MLIVAVALALVDCAHPQKTEWLIESWENGVFTIRHEGYTYKAVCDGTVDVVEGHPLIVSSDGSHADFSEKAEQAYHGSPPMCAWAVGLLGENIHDANPEMLPAGGREKNGDGWVITMMHARDSLMLQRWRDEKSHSQELFKIISVIGK